MNGETEVPGWFGPSWRIVGRVSSALPCLVLFPSPRRSLFPAVSSLASLEMGPVPSQTGTSQTSP